MNIIRGLHNLKTHKLNHPNFSCVATIGNFDGVHSGHQEIIEHLHEKATAYNLPSVVMIFEPHPKEFFADHFPERVPHRPPRLSRFRDKIRLLEQFNVDTVLVIHFNKHFSSLSADEFVEQVLVHQLGIKYMLIGDDFCYGHRRQGNYQHLCRYAKELGFDVDSTQTITFQSERISSTRVRETLQAGDLDKVKTLLNRHFSISGHVQHGAKMGRTIGFPTANVGLACKQPPLTGVYTVKMRLICSNTTINGIANIGYRPTVDGKKPLLEVNLFDFSEDLYGQYVQVDFFSKIRDEKKFDSFDDLKEQIQKDVAVAKKYFTINKN